MVYKLLLILVTFFRKGITEKTKIETINNNKK